MTDEFDPQVIGIVDEREPEEPEEASAEESTQSQGEDTDGTEVEAATKDTPADQDADGEGEPTEGSDAAPADETDTQAKDEGESESEPIQFAGREWKNLDQIEQAFKSWEGRLSASDEKVRDYEQRLSDYYQYVENVAAENEQLRAQLAGGKPEGETPEGETPEAKADGSIDMKRILELAKFAADRHGVDPTEAALRMYHEESEKRLNARLSELEAKATEPVREAEAEAEVARAERELFQWAQDLKSEGGDPLYPMLQRENLDDDFTANVYEAWKRLGQEYGVQFQYSRLGIDQAYGLAKQYAVSQGWTEPGSAPVQPESNSRTTRDPNTGRFMSNSDAEAASDLTGDTPSIGNKPKPRSSLADLDDVKEVAFAGGESLGFFE